MRPESRPAVIAALGRVSLATDDDVCAVRRGSGVKAYRNTHHVGIDSDQNQAAALSTRSQGKASHVSKKCHSKHGGGHHSHPDFVGVKVMSKKCNKNLSRQLSPPP